VRQIEAKAQAIEDAAFDLKAVNPHAKTDEDSRTPAELIEFIEKKGLEVQLALGILRKLAEDAPNSKSFSYECFS